MRCPPFNFGEKTNRADLSTQSASNTFERVVKNYEVPQNRGFGLQNCNNLAPWVQNFSLPRTTSRDLTLKITLNKNLIVFYNTFGCILIDCCTIWRSSITHAKVECWPRNCLKTERKNVVTCYTPL